MGMASYRECWKIIKENTSSQGPHTGMYKAVAQHPLLGRIFHQKSETLYLSVYSLRRHCIGTAVMLTKQADSWDVKDLRTIFLLDLEANHTHKRIGR